MKISQFTKLLSIVLFVSLTACQQIKPKVKGGGNASTADTSSATATGTSASTGSNTGTNTGTGSGTGTGASTTTDSKAGTGTNSATGTGADVTPHGKDDKKLSISAPSLSVEAGKQLTLTVNNGTAPFTLGASAIKTVITIKDRAITYNAPAVAGTEEVSVTDSKGVKASIKVTTTVKAPVASGWKTLDASANGATELTASENSAVWNDKDDVALIWGGTLNDVELNTGICYNPKTGKIDPIAVDGATPAARSKHYAFWAGSDIGMVVYGGNSVKNSTILLDGGIYNTKTKSWKPIPAPQGALVPAIYDVAMVTANGAKKLVVVGQPSDEKIKNMSGGVYEVKADGTGAWAELNVKSLPLMDALTVTAVGSKVLVWGLAQADHTKPYGAFLDLADAKSTWTTVSLEKAPAASDMTIAALGNKVLFWGGLSNLDAPADATGGNPKGSDDAASPAAKTCGAVLDLETNTWTAIEKGPAGTPALDVTALAVWKGGNEVMVWGALGDATNSAGIYDIATKTWTVVDPLPAYSAGYRGNELWTGTSVLTIGTLNAMYTPKVVNKVVTN